MKRPAGVTVISIAAIVYGVLDIVDFLFFQPVVTEKRIEYSIPFLGVIFLISGIGTLALKRWARTGMVIGCMLATYYSGLEIYHIGLHATIILHVVFIVLYGSVIFYLTSQKIGMRFKKTSEFSRDSKEIDEKSKAIAQCYHHLEREAIGTCPYCNRHLCSECLKPTGSCKSESDCLAYQSGEYSPAQHVESPSTLEDTMAIPEEEMDIIGDYGETLDALAAEKSSRLLHPLSKLPHTKEKIENALRTALGIVKSQEMRNHLETVLLALEDFVPDNEVPADPEENMKAWIRRKDWKNPKQRNQLARILTRFFVEKYGENADQELQAFFREMGPRKEKNI